MKYLLAQQSLQLAFARSHQANFDKPGGLGTLSGFQQLNWSGGGGGGGLLQPQISAPATITAQPAGLSFPITFTETVLLVLTPDAASSLVSPTA